MNCFHKCLFVIKLVQGVTPRTTTQVIRYFVPQLRDFIKSSPMVVNLLRAQHGHVQSPRLMNTISGI